jgi:hypothetical protein
VADFYKSSRSTFPAISFSILDLLNMVNLRLPLTSILAISFSASSRFSHQNSTTSATRLINRLLSVLSGIGVSGQPQFAQPCTSHVDCEDLDVGAQVFCSPDGICGGDLRNANLERGLLLRLARPSLVFLVSTSRLSPVKNRAKVLSYRSMQG